METSDYFPGDTTSTEGTTPGIVVSTPFIWTPDRRCSYEPCFPGSWEQERYQGQSILKDFILVLPRSFEGQQSCIHGSLIQKFSSFFFIGPKSLLLSSSVSYKC